MTAPIRTAKAITLLTTLSLALLLMTSCGEKKNQVFGVGEVDKPPVFPGQIAEYIQENLDYPESARKDSISGIIRVQFVVNDYGNTEQIKVTDSLSPAFDSAVVQMVRNMPQWEPATIDDFPVRVLVEIPVKFDYRDLEGLEGKVESDTISSGS